MAPKKGSVAVKRRTVIVNDRMQQGYRYVLVAPVGRNFDSGFRPELTPPEMLRLGVFGGKYMTDCRDEFPGQLVRKGKALPGTLRRQGEFLRGCCEPAALG